jgi:hypothetical protein
VVSVKKYPTTFTDLDAWTNPGNATGPEDGVCAVKNTIALGGPYVLKLMGYGFSLPANAILDNYFIDHKGVVDSAFAPNLQMEYVSETPTTIVFVDNSSVDMLGGNCAVSAYAGEMDILPFMKSNNRVPTIAQINGEIGWHTDVFAQPDRPLAERFFVDACYIRIVYHVPSAFLRRLLVGEGL